METPNTGFPKNYKNTIVFFDIKFDKIKGGRVIIKLFDDIVPKTAENFRALCTGEKGIGKHGQPLHYKGTKIHRVVPLCLVQGGDILTNNGTGGESIYGDQFDDENLQDVRHVEDGMVGMSNRGPNTNNSQFYITTAPCIHLDGRNVIVGKVVKGLSVIVEMSNFLRENDTPLHDIIIENCGEIKEGEPWNIGECDGTADIYPAWPDDWDMKIVNNSEEIERAINNIKESGNYYFKINNLIDADRKYTKTLRYIDWYIKRKNGSKERMENVRIITLQNLAAVKLGRSKNKEVIQLCDQILKKGDYVKAYYRRARAKISLQEYDKAIDDLNMALLLSPNDEKIKMTLQLTKKNKLQKWVSDKKTFAKLFQ